jgi:serine/threonine-protein kinase
VASTSLPTAIGPYRVLSEIGRGMMGVVYKAEDTRSRRPVALKVIRFAMAISEEQRQMFERRFVEEAQIVAKLDHPNIVGVYEIGRDSTENAPFIAFEYLEGRTLAARLEDGPLPWKDALKLVARIADALHHAHEQGVIHRDIKPANIMLLRSGEPKLMDFGLAKREAGAELTSTGQFLGTPLYMSPEQALGRKVDARTDVFSLGGVAYTLLTGRRAFEAESIPQVMNKVTYQHPPRPTQVVGSLPAEVDYLVARAMAKSPDDRYPTAQAFLEDIQDVLKRRAPRHRASWSAVGVGEGTVVAPRTAPDPEDSLPEIALESSEPTRRRRGTAGPAAWLGLSMLALGAVLYSSAFWTRLAGLGEPDLPPPTLGIPAGSPTSDPATTAEPSSAPATTQPTVAAAAPPTTTEAPTAEPTAEPTEPPTPTAASTPSARTATRARTPDARLSIALEHSLKSGMLRIFVDKDLVLDERLSSKVTKDLLVFKQRSGKVEDVLTVTPGNHRVRVEVKADRETHSREIRATFKGGVTRRLEIKLKGDSVNLFWR